MFLQKVVDQLHLGLMITFLGFDLEGTSSSDSLAEAIEATEATRGLDLGVPLEAVLPNNILNQLLRVNAPVHMT